MGDPPEEGSFMWGGKAEVAKRPVITIGKVYGVSHGTSTVI
jgi:hypothetical protein